MIHFAEMEGFFVNHIAKTKLKWYTLTLIQLQERC